MGQTILVVITLVLPDPAPARIKNGFPVLQYRPPLFKIEDFKTGRTIASHAVLQQKMERLK